MTPVERARAEAERSREEWCEKNNPGGPWVCKCSKCEKERAEAKEAKAKALAAELLAMGEL